MSEIFGSLRYSSEFLGKTRKGDPKRSKIAEIVFCVVYKIFHVSFSEDSCSNLCIYLFVNLYTNLFFKTITKDEYMYVYIEHP